MATWERVGMILGRAGSFGKVRVTSPTAIRLASTAVWLKMAPTATLEYASHAPEPLPYSRVPKHSLLPCNTPDYLRLIITSKVYDILKETPLIYAPNLSAKLGSEIWLKREDLQEVFSFKIRGAYNFMASLSKEERWKGVITCSAGQCTYALTS